MDKKVKGPSLNIWRVLKSFSVKKGKGIKNFQIKKGELLFLIAEDTDYYIFKTENDNTLSIHKNVESKGYVTQVFKC